MIDKIFAEVGRAGREIDRFVHVRFLDIVTLFYSCGPEMLWPLQLRYFSSPFDTSSVG